MKVDWIWFCINGSWLKLPLKVCHNLHGRSHSWGPKAGVYNTNLGWNGKTIQPCALQRPSVAYEIPVNFNQEFPFPFNSLKLWGARCVFLICNIRLKCGLGVSWKDTWICCECLRTIITMPPFASRTLIHLTRIKGSIRVADQP